MARPIRIAVLANALYSSRSAGRAVIPAKAGIQCFKALLDSRLRGSDDRDGLGSLPFTIHATCRTGSLPSFLEKLLDCIQDCSVIRLLRNLFDELDVS
jgi:hypothetical protein